jgi:hypothetical protein
MHSQNYKLTPAPSEIASQFPPPRTFELSHMQLQLLAKDGDQFVHIIGAPSELATQTLF